MESLALGPQAVLWLGAAVYLVSVGWGEISTVTTGPDGAQITETHRSSSALESSPETAEKVLLATLGWAAIAMLLIRFGGITGGLIVMVVSGMATLAAMLTIGVFIAPGTACMGAAALLAIADRSASKRSRCSLTGS